MDCSESRGTLRRRSKWLSPGLLCALLGFVLSSTNAHAETVTYILDNVVLAGCAPGDCHWPPGDVITGTFVWSFEPGDFEGGSGAFTALEIPAPLANWSPYVELITQIETNQIEFTGAGSFHDVGLDVTIVLLQDLSLITPSYIDLTSSKFECCGNGFRDQLFMSGRILPASHLLSVGINLISMPAFTPTGLESCFALLLKIGEGNVNEILRIDPATQATANCAFAGGIPAGEDFPLASGEGYIVDMANVMAIALVGNQLSCPDLKIAPGVNLIGIPSPAEGLSCYDLLGMLGEANASAIEKLYNARGSFGVCAFENRVLVGEDFPITSGQGYSVNAVSSVSLSAAQISDPTRCP